MRPMHMASSLIDARKPAGTASIGPGATMSDIAVAGIPITEADRSPPPALAAAARNALLDRPILRTLLELAWPNVIALSAGTCVVIAETSYIGRLGVESLAAMALVFPFVILTMTCRVARWAAAWRRRLRARSVPAMSIAPRRWPRTLC